MFFTETLSNKLFHELYNEQNFFKKLEKCQRNKTELLLFINSCEDLFKVLLVQKQVVL